jgi:multidrug transporter EmrE-like cation transporter
MSYFYVACTILLTVYSQLIIKWQVIGAGAFPADTADKAWFLARLLVNPWVVSALVALMVAVVTWMAAMTKLELSHAYPFVSLAFVLVVLCSAWFFNEPLTATKLAGLALVCVGIVIGSQG